MSDSYHTRGAQADRERTWRLLERIATALERMVELVEIEDASPAREEVCVCGHDHDLHHATSSERECGICDCMFFTAA